VNILSATTYDGSTTTVEGEKFKGDGYYGSNDGLHTVSWHLDGFQGTIKIQGTLVQSPESSDWFDIELENLNFSIDTTGNVSREKITSVNYSDITTGNAMYNFTGNFMWIRVAVVNFAAGTVSKVLYNN